MIDANDKPPKGLPQGRHNLCDEDLAIGLDADDRPVHISSVVVKGKACGLRCPSCQESLIAHLKNDKRRRHFQHEPGGNCRFAGESGLHRYAKALIEAKGELLLPAVHFEDGSRIKSETRPRFDQVRLEQRFHSIIPDVIARKGAHELMIEIRVTHPCDERKRAILQDLKISTLEIDLSKFRGINNRELLDEQILEKAPRKWLYHSAHAREAQRRAEAARAAINAKAAQYRAKVERTLATSEADKPSLGRWLTDISTYGLQDLVGIPIAGDDSMRVQRTEWQSMLLSHFIHSATSVADLESADIALANVDYIDVSEFHDDQDAIQRLVDLVPAFRRPREVLYDYFNALEALGGLGSGWSLDNGRIFDARVKIEQRRLAERDQRAKAEEARLRQKLLREQEAIRAVETARHADLESQRFARHRSELWELVTHALSGATDEERSRFDFELWILEPQSNGKSPLEQMMASDLFVYSPLMQDLKKIPRIYKPGTRPMSDLLKLPLEAHQQRRIEEQESRSEARARKLHDLYNIVRSALPDAYLETPQKCFDGLTPLAFGRRSEDNQWQVIDQMKASPPARDLCESAEQSADQLRRRCRLSLSRAADDVLVDRAQQWLHTHHSMLGGPPQEMCTDETSLSRCLLALERDVGTSLDGRYR